MLRLAVVCSRVLLGIWVLVSVNSLKTPRSEAQTICESADAQNRLFPELFQFVCGFILEGLTFLPSCWAQFCLDMLCPSTIRNTWTECISLLWPWPLSVSETCCQRAEEQNYGIDERRQKGNVLSNAIFRCVIVSVLGVSLFSFLVGAASATATRMAGTS